MKPFDLEERTLKFSQSTLLFCKGIRKSVDNVELVKQLVRSAGSVGANYREANEAISKRDFVHRLRICRKEAKESNYWVRLLKFNNNLTGDCDLLIVESQELVKIFSAIIEKILANR